MDSIKHRLCARTQLQWLPLPLSVPARRSSSSSSSSSKGNSNISIISSSCCSCWPAVDAAALITVSRVAAAAAGPGRKPRASCRLSRRSRKSSSCDVTARTTIDVTSERTVAAAAASWNETVVMRRSARRSSLTAAQTRSFRSASLSGDPLAGPAPSSWSRPVSAVASSLLVSFVLLSLPFYRFPLCFASSSVGKNYLRRGRSSFNNIHYWTKNIS